MTTTQYAKRIKYNRDTKDYDLLLDDEYIGSARTYHEGEVTLDQLVFELLSGQSPVADEPTQPDLAADLYNVVCLVLSGAAATTAIAELRRVQERYEQEHNTASTSPLERWREQGKAEQDRIAKLHL